MLNKLLINTCTREQQCHVELKQHRHQDAIRATTLSREISLMLYDVKLSHMPSDAQNKRNKIHVNVIVML